MLSSASRPRKKRVARNPDATVFIYGLACPREWRIRYVGQSVDPVKRFVAHVRRPTNDGVDGWITDLLRCGELPVMAILEVSTVGEADGRESFWIRHYFSNSRSLNRRSTPNVRRLRQVRMTDREWALIQRVAEQDGVSASDLVRAGALDEAKRLLKAASP